MDARNHFFLENFKNSLFIRFGNAVTISIFHFFVSKNFLSENNVKILVSLKSSDSIRSSKTFKTPHGIIRQFTKAILIYK